MKAGRPLAAILVLCAVAAPSAWAQTRPAGGTTRPGIAQAPATVPGVQPNQGMSEVQRMEASPMQRLQMMQNDLEKMRALLDDMRKKVDTAGSAKSEMTDNVHLWELMLGYMDRSLAQARAAAASRGWLKRAGANEPGAMMRRGSLPLPKASGTPSGKDQPAPTAQSAGQPPKP